MDHVLLPRLHERLHERFCERFCIGLTGGIASGKSTASEHFATLGAAVVDTDVIAHQLTQPGGEAMAAIEAAFGPKFINPDGSLNRSEMRAQVFSNPAERALLEAILHPMIGVKTRELGANVPGDYVVFVVPLLVEGTRWRQQVDRIVVVDCEPSVQLARLVQRPEMNLQQAQQIMAAQASRETRLAMADAVIANHGTPEALKASVQQWHRSFSELALAHASAIR